ncbi:UNVERIFIED_CONTAM: hypothetical protein FKN15_069210 [Acipenser sinensis]
MVSFSEYKDSKFDPLQKSGFVFCSPVSVFKEIDHGTLGKILREQDCCTE